MHIISHFLLLALFNVSFCYVIPTREADYFEIHHYHEKNAISYLHDDSHSHLHSQPTSYQYEIAVPAHDRHSFSESKLKHRLEAHAHHMPELLSKNYQVDPEFLQELANIVELIQSVLIAEEQDFSYSSSNNGEPRLQGIVLDSICKDLLTFINRNNI